MFFTNLLHYSKTAFKINMLKNQSEICPKSDDE